MSERPWSSRSSKDTFFGLHYPLTWLNGFCGGRGKRGVPVKKGKGPWQRKYCYNQFLMKFYLGREDEDKRRQNNGQT